VSDEDQSESGVERLEHKVVAELGVEGLGLERNAVGLSHVLGQSLANVGPTIAVLFTTALIVTKAGVSAPFAVVIIVLGLGMTAVSVAIMCRHLPAAGVLYAAPAQAFGSSVGVGIAIMLFLLYTLETCSTAAFMSGLVSQLIKTETGASIPWAVILAVVLGFYGFLAWTGIKDVLRFTMVFITCEMVIVLFISFVIIFKGGAAGQVPSAFLPSFGHGGGGFSAVAGAFVFGLFALGGFESSAGTAEESRRPRLFIPLAVVGAVLIGGALLFISTYAMVIGYGPHHLSALTSNPNPMVPLGERFIGHWYGVVLSLALISATLGASLASLTLTIRLQYALGRDGILPRALGRTHPKHHSPHVSAAVAVVISYIFGVLFAVIYGVTTQYGYSGYLTGIGIGAAYLMFNIAMITYMWRRQRERFRWAVHGLLGVIATSLVGFGIWASVHPLPSGPDRVMLIVFGGWLVVAVVGAAMLKWKAPDKLEKVLSAGARAEKGFIDVDS
jgi:amino acid transporter